MESDETIARLVRERISIDPKVLVGKPVIRGTRISVSLVLDFVANGHTFDEIIEHYPMLNKEDIRAALLYASASLNSEESFAIAGYM